MARGHAREQRMLDHAPTGLHRRASTACYAQLGAARSMLTYAMSADVLKRAMVSKWQLHRSQRQDRVCNHITAFRNSGYVAVGASESHIGFKCCASRSRLRARAPVKTPLLQTGQPLLRRSVF